MEFTLGDIIMFFTFLGGLVGVWVFHTNRTTRLETRFDAFMNTARERIAEVQIAVAENRKRIEQDRRYVIEKLAHIESSQNETNMFLKENLKNLTRIITVHEEQIRELKKTIDRNASDAYQNFEQKKK